jgi:hypothetical protein
MNLTTREFEFLTTTSMRCGYQWHDRADRFDLIDANGFEEVQLDYGMIYWLGDNYSNVIFAKMFLDASSADYQTAWDESAEEFCVLTNFHTPSWNNQ